MKLVIAGAGVAGSYLYALAKDEMDITVYDNNIAFRGHGCGWGSSRAELGEKLSKVGLRVDDYVLSSPTSMCINGIRFPIEDQIVIDKPRMLRDLLPDSRVINQTISTDSLEKSDSLAVNATNKPQNPYMTANMLQAKARVESLEPNTMYVEVDPTKAGYAWAFPLDYEGKTWHLGAGSDGEPSLLLERLKKRYRMKLGTPTCKCGRPLHVIDPLQAVLWSGGVAHVGEAAGMLNPLTGEGILPSMESALLLWLSFRRGRLARNWYVHGMEEELEKLREPYEIAMQMQRRPRWAWPRAFAYTKRSKSFRLTMAQKIIFLLKILLWG